MRQRSDLRPYQLEKKDYIVDHPSAMLWMDIGSGKTATTLTAIEELFDRGEVYGVLIVAPLLVAQTVWRQEIAEWEHLGWLKAALVHGGPDERKMMLRARANIYLTNYENMVWLVNHLKSEYLLKGKALPFNMVVFDEITRMKASGSAKRVAAYRKIMGLFRRRVGLTGSPAPNGLVDLHGQYLCLDGGERLFPSVTTYRETFFIYDQWKRTWMLRKGQGKVILNRIADITTQLRASDYIQLPKVVELEYRVELDPKARDAYVKMEKEFFVELDSGAVEAYNETAKVGKCLQIANGACYTHDENTRERTGWAHVHDAKLEQLDQIVESLQGKPLLVAYSFVHDKDRILARYPKKAVFMKEGDVAWTVARWNKGEIQMLVGHPASMGHGLNLQHGGNHIALIGLPWSLELYEQMIGRLARSGQKEDRVFVHRILAKDTLDEAVSLALKRKANTQEGLRDAVKAYREGRHTAEYDGGGVSEVRQNPGDQGGR